jgi:putative aldouronate transport system permease protein
MQKTVYNPQRPAALHLTRAGAYFTRMGKYWQIYLLMLAGILFYIIFKLLPIWGLGTAFVDFNLGKGLLASKFVGLKHFNNFLGSSHFPRLLRNTMVISSMDLFLAFPIPIILSLLLNEIRSAKFKRLTQSIIYMPHFMSWVVIASLTFFLFSTDVGIVNKLIVKLGGQASPLLTTQETFWWVLLGQTIWKEMGWGTIIYLAAISQVDQGLYEAAIMDGANRFQQVLHVTIPSIMPTLIVMFLMKLGKLMNVSFEQVWMMTNDMVRNVAETFETYSFRVGVQMGNYSVGATVGLFKSLVGVLLVVGSNWMIKKTGHDGIY